jgi:acyl-CoA hydrolase
MTQTLIERAVESKPMAQTWIDRAVSAEDAVSHVLSGMKVFVHGAAATPAMLINALAKRDIENITTYHLHLDGNIALCDPALAERFRPTSLFIGANMRAPVNEGRADFTPVFPLTSLLFDAADSARRRDSALSPPDKHGYCTLGTSADCAVAASRAARGSSSPRSTIRCRAHGNARARRQHHRVRPHEPSAAEHPPAEASEAEEAIGSHIASLIPDGATLQMGIGAIPDAVLSRLFDNTTSACHRAVLGPRDRSRRSGRDRIGGRRCTRAASRRRSSMDRGGCTTSWTTIRSSSSIRPITRTTRR